MVTDYDQSHSADIQWVQAEGIVHGDEAEWVSVVPASSTVTAESLLTCFLQPVYRAD